MLFLKMIMCKKIQMIVSKNNHLDVIAMECSATSKTPGGTPWDSRGCLLGLQGVLPRELWGHVQITFFTHDHV